MTLGQKIKTARINANLTQAELADKLSVSRPAITKWERDRGIPDIENLKLLSSLLNVSLDYLLKDEIEPAFDTTIREPIDLKAYGKGFKKKLKDKLIRDKFPDCEIITLIPKRILTRGERIIDWLLVFFTDAGFGTPDLINYTKLWGNEFYLVVKQDGQYLVTVSNEFLESRRLTSTVETKSGSKFIVGDLKFLSCGPIVYVK